VWPQPRGEPRLFAEKYATEAAHLFVVVLECAFGDLPHRERGRRRPEHVGHLAHAPNVREQIRHGRMMPRRVLDAPGTAARRAVSAPLAALSDVPLQGRAATG
jgi:hypothetical protein